MFTLQTIMRVYLSSSKARICLDMNDVYLFETKIEYAHIWFRDDELSAHWSRFFISLLASNLSLIWFIHCCVFRPVSRT